MRKKNSTNTVNKSHLEETCGMAYTISLIGGRWKLSILGLLVDYGKLRYNELQKQLTGISERILAKQLKELEEDGLIARNIIPEVPIRVEYGLSMKGRSLTPVLNAMSDWGTTQVRNLDIKQVANDTAL